MKLGKPNGAAALRRAGKGGAALRATVSANVGAHAADLAAVLADIHASGHLSLRAIATEFDDGACGHGDEASGRCRKSGA